MAKLLLIGGGIMYDVYQCSACGFEAAHSLTDNGIKWEFCDINFCPNCGEKLEYIGNPCWLQEESE